MRMKWRALLLGILIVTAVLLDDARALGPLYIVYIIPYGDKVAHFMLFGLLSMFLNLAAFEKWPGLPHITLALRIDGLLMALMALEELSQTLFPQRRASIWDVFAGYLGVAAFTALALVIANRKKTVTT